MPVSKNRALRFFALGKPREMCAPRLVKPTQPLNIIPTNVGGFILLPQFWMLRLLYLPKSHQIYALIGQTRHRLKKYTAFWIARWY